MNQISTGNNGSIHHNVIWNAIGGIMARRTINISNNTVFGERVDGKNNIIILHEQNTGNEKVLQLGIMHWTEFLSFKHIWIILWKMVHME